MSDALETIVNIITAIVLIWAVKFSTEPADEEHPYGHGKFENVTASFEGGLIFFAALAILFQSIESFFVPVVLENILDGNFYLIAATVINLAAAILLINLGNKKKSEALKANGKHILSDVVTSVGVIIGLYVAKLTGIPRIDSAIGFLVGLWLLKEAYEILRTNSAALLDEADPLSVGELGSIIQSHKTPEVIDIHNLRMIRSGNFHHIDAHVVVPEFMDVAKVHNLTHEFEKKVVRDYKFEGEFAFHIDPCKRSFCKRCELADCHIRAVPFVATEIVSPEFIIKGPRYTN
jgi:cation diffusion facilitator family transporter